MATFQPTIKGAALRHRGKSTNDCGFSLVEALVASFLLMLSVSQSLSIFGTTMSALGTSRLRDSLNAAVHADLESVRNEIGSWSANNNIDGMISYAPDAIACKTNTLASKLIEDNAGNAKLVSIDPIRINTSIPLRGITIKRETKVFSSGLNAANQGEGNLVDVSYASSANSFVKIERRSILSIPAQGWCVYD